MYFNRIMLQSIFPNWQGPSSKRETWRIGVGQLVLLISIQLKMLGVSCQDWSTKMEGNLILNWKVPSDYSRRNNNLESDFIKKKLILSIIFWKIWKYNFILNNFLCQKYIFFVIIDFSCFLYIIFGCRKNTFLVFLLSLKIIFHQVQCKTIYISH